MRPYSKRRIVKKVWRMATVKLRKLFKIPNNEMIIDFQFDKSNQELILTTLQDYDEKQGDI